MASVLACIVALLCFKRSKASPTASPRACVELEVPVSIDTTAIKWLQPRVDSNIDAVDWVANATTWTSPNMTESMIGTITVKQTFKINGQLCLPPKGSSKRSDILHLTTHGGGFDKRYWDPEIKTKEYSYVEAALAEGYSVFTYDRIGTGKSDKPDAYDIMQLNVQREILRKLTSLARSGRLVSVSKNLSRSSSQTDSRLTNYKPSRIVHVGHSLGSILSIGLIQNYPTESDGVIATGFLHTNVQLGGLNVATWGFEFARENNPVLFRDHGSGYCVQATPSNVQLQFLKKGTFEPALLDYAWRIRQPVAVAEFKSLLTAFGPPDGGAKFKGPVHMVIGENDYGNCAGDCKGTYDLDMIRTQIYPAAKDVGVLIQPGTGHGLALSKNATAGYRVSFDFLHKSGL